MIELRASYEVADFVPFSAEVYFRLLERIGESLWPLQLLALAIGVAALCLSLVGRVRIAGVLLALCWVFVGINFFIRHYAQLNWAGGYIGWAFLLQAGLLLLFAIMGRNAAEVAPRYVVFIFGVVVAVTGLAVYPLIAPLLGMSWFQAETFTIHADPTALGTLGLLLLMARGWWLWLLALIPLLWCVLAGLTLQVLDAPWALILFLGAGVVLIGMIWTACLANLTKRGETTESL